jgi:hypothetical protein
MVKKGLYLFLLLVVFMSFTIGNVQASQINGKGGAEVQGPDSIKSAVHGTIKDNGAPVGNVLVMIQEKGRSNWIQTRTDASGTFKTRLTDGTYAIKGIAGSGSNTYGTNESFIVKDGKIEGEINLSGKKQGKKPLAQSGNLTGVIKEGSKGLKADLVLLKEHNGNVVDVYTVSSKGDGNFTASLPDGDYYLNGIEFDGGIYIYALSFKVEGGIVLVDGEPEDYLAITVPVEKYAGKLADSFKPLSGAHILLEKQGIEYDEFIQEVITNNQGAFSLRALSDGVYSLSVNHGTYSSWKHITFEVVNGDIYIDGQKTEIVKMTVPDVNVQGIIMDGNKPISNGNITFTGETADGENSYYYTVVDSKGEFQYRLKDGQYKIIEINEELSNTRVDVSFEIREGQLVQEGEAKSTLTIELPPITLSGKLIDSGTVVQGRADIHSDENYEWYHAETDEKGIFSLRLKDGSYKVSYGSLIDGQEGFSVSTSFEIINGQLFVDGEKRELLEIQVPPISLHGIVKEGERAVTFGYYSVCSNDQSFCSGRSLNPDGTFTLRLSDGDYIFSIVNLEDGTSVTINQEFSILDGKTYVNGQLQDLLEISVPTVTLTGFVTESGNPITGSLSISQTNNETYPQTFWGRTDEEGRFNFRLPDGDYKVSNVFPDDRTEFRAEKEFSIVSGQLIIDGQIQDTLEISIPPVTLKGILTESGTPLTGQLNIMEMYDADNPLQLMAWANEDGQFQSRLPDGTYRVSNVYLQDGGSYSPELEFEIVSGHLYVNGQLQETLEISVPQVTLKGVLSDSGNPVSGGISIGNLDYPHSIWVQANEEGKFQSRLQDGNYRVYNVTLNDGSSFNPTIEFSIVSGVIYVNGELIDELAIEVPPISLTGNVKYGGEPVIQGYMVINSIGETGGMGVTIGFQNGLFQSRLPDGDYELAYVQDYQHGYFPLGKKFTILDGKLLVDGQEVNTLDLNL